MTLQDFVTTWSGRYCDFDGWYGAQCVDLVQFYNRDVVGAGRFTGNAKDIFGQQADKYTWVRNSPAGVPPAGAVVVYGARWGGGNGHVVIALPGGNTNTFPALSQNYPNATNTHTVLMSYYDCTGWGIPKVNVQPGLMRVPIRSLVNVRVQPKTSAAIAGQLHVGYCDITGQVQGDAGTVGIHSSNMWGVTQNGHYFNMAATL